MEALLSCRTFLSFVFNICSGQMLNIQTMRGLLSEWWTHVLLTYRTMVIKAEWKRRAAIADQCKKSGLRSDQNQIKRHKQSAVCDGMINIQSDVSSSGSTPSTMYNCNPSEMRRVFDLLDENKDGCICAEDLQLFVKRLGFELSDQEVKGMLQTIDRNDDDGVDIEKFFSVYRRDELEGDHTTEDYRNIERRVREDAYEEEALLKTFFIFDENRDGLISAPELQQVLLRFGLPEGRSLMRCKQMIGKVDASGNGQVDFFQFRDFMWKRPTK